MRVSARGLLAVGLVAGFYLLAFAIMAGLLAVDALAVAQARVEAVKLLLLTAPVVVALGRGLWAVTAVPREPEPGVAVTRRDQPGLWAFVAGLAERVGTRPPDEIRLVLDVNAAVAEQAKMLGLRHGTRRLYVGAPLLASLTEAQLAAVLAHELGHYGHRDTHFAATTYRGWEAIKRSVAHLHAGRGFQRLISMVFVRYARLYFRVASSVCRRQELAADLVAARIAGAAAAVGALREVPALNAAWSYFVKRYLTIGWRAGFLPDRMAEGFRAWLAEPAHQAELERIRLAPLDDPASPYDSHPPVAQRIAAIERAGSEPAAAERLAIGLIRDPDLAFETVVRGSIAAPEAGLTRVGWPALIHLAARAAAVEAIDPLLDAAARITGRAGGLAAVLDAIDDGRLAELGVPLTEAGNGAGPRVQLEMARTAVRKTLSTAVVVALADAGKARWALSWSEQAALVIDEPYGDGLTELLDASVAEGGSTAGLRALLAAASADTGNRPAMRPAVHSVPTSA